MAESQIKVEMVMLPKHLADKIQEEHILMFAALCKIKETTGLFEVFSGEDAGVVQEAHALSDGAIKMVIA